MAWDGSWPRNFATGAPASTPAARDPRAVDLAGVTPIALDITDPASVAAAAQTASGVAILVNNAGSSTGSSLLTGDLAAIRLEMDTHFFGTLAVTRAFAPQLAAQRIPIGRLAARSWPHAGPQPDDRPFVPGASTAVRS